MSLAKRRRQKHQIFQIMANSSWRDQVSTLFSVASFYEDEIWLYRAFEEEVLAAIKTCAPDKAPRLDGYTMALSKSMGLHQAGYYGNHEPLPSKRSNGQSHQCLLPCTCPQKERYNGTQASVEVYTSRGD